eukprot:4300192-Prymnesium_polylepis.1
MWCAYARSRARTRSRSLTRRRAHWRGACSEPLSFLLGAGNILAGMEKALVGACEGDVVSAMIPPEMGFDDPAKQFTRKP